MLKTVAIINQWVATQVIAQTPSLLRQILDGLKQALVTALQHGFLIILLFCCAIVLAGILLKGVLLRKRSAFVPGQRAYTDKGHGRTGIYSSYDETSFSREEDSTEHDADTAENDDGVYIIPRTRGWQSRVNAIDAGDADSVSQILLATRTAEDSQDEDVEEDGAIDDNDDGFADEEDATDLDAQLEDEDTVEEEPGDDDEEDDVVEEDGTVDEEDNSDDPVDVSEDSPLSENMLDEEAEGQDASANEEIVSVEDSDEDEVATYESDADEGDAEDSEDDGDAEDSGDDSGDGDSGE